MNSLTRIWSGLFLVRAFRTCPALALGFVLFCGGQLWSASDGVIRFPFVHWWMYGGEFLLPEHSTVHWVSSDSIPLDPALLGGRLPRYKTIGLLENQMAMRSKEGYGQIAAEEWIKGKAGEWMGDWLPERSYEKVSARIVPMEPDSLAWQAWLDRVAHHQLPEGQCVTPAIYCIEYPELFLYMGGCPIEP